MTHFCYEKNQYLYRLNLQIAAVATTTVHEHKPTWTCNNYLPTQLQFELFLTAAGTSSCCWRLLRENWLFRARKWKGKVMRQSMCRTRRKIMSLFHLWASPLFIALPHRHHLTYHVTGIENDLQCKLHLEMSTKKGELGELGRFSAVIRHCTIIKA